MYVCFALVDLENTLYKMHDTCHQVHRFYRWCKFLTFTIRTKILLCWT